MDEKETTMPRSRSLAVIQEAAQASATAAAAAAISGRKQSDPFNYEAAQQLVDASLTPIHEAQSYRINAANQAAVEGPVHCPQQHEQQQEHQQQQEQQQKTVKRLMETLLLDLPDQSTPSRHSAASLKVHFRSVDDVSCPDDDGEPTSNGHQGGQQSGDDGQPAYSGLYDSQRRRTYSEATSWTASESDIDNGHVAGDETDGDEREEGFVAPDGGWGWMVVAASFVVNLIADGVTFSFGIVNAQLRNYFQESYGYTAWIYGLFMAIPLLSGPLASSLSDRYGCRPVTIAGSILAAFAFIIGSLSNSLEMLFFVVGIVSGFGLSLCYVAAIVIVAYYFEKRRSLATGLAVCGSGIGNFIVAPVTQYLIDEYGWRGTMLIVAGFFLNMSVCGALMRDIEGAGKRQSRKEGRRSRNCSESQYCPTPDRMTDDFLTNGTFNDHPDSGTGAGDLLGPAGQFKYLDGGADDDGGGGADARLCNSLISLPTFLVDAHGRDKIPHEVLMTIPNNPRLYSIVLHNYPTLFDEYIADRNGEKASAVSAVNGTSDGAKDQTPTGKGQAVSHKDLFLMNSAGPGFHLDASRPATQHWNAAYLKGLRVKKRSLTYRGAMLNLPRYRLRASSCPDIYRNSITTIAREKGGAWDYVEELREVVMDMFDVSYLANTRLVMFIISNILLYSWYHVPYGYVVEWALEQGHSEEEAPFLLSIVGMLNTIGVVALGYVGDRSWANATWIYSGSMLVCGLSTAAVPLLQTYAGLATACGLFGLSIAANYALAAVILVDLISLERFVNAYGLLLMFQGLANLVGPPVAGWICDVTGSYDASFYIAGAFIVLSGVILVMLPAFQHVRLRWTSADDGAADLETGAVKETTALKESAKLNPQASKTISTPI